MAETYPDDATLDAFTGDAQTGIDAIPRGTSPYFRAFQKILTRLVRDLAPLGLRVYPTGALTVQVTGGTCSWSTGAGWFAGTGSDLTLTDNIVNCIWLNPDYTVGLAVGGGAWPTTEHIKLASIQTLSGGWTPANFTDYRGASMLTSWRPPLPGSDLVTHYVQTGTTTDAAWTYLSPPLILPDNQHYAIEARVFARRVGYHPATSNNESESGMMFMAGTCFRDAGQIWPGQDCLIWYVWGTDLLNYSDSTPWGGAGLVTGGPYGDPSLDAGAVLVGVGGADSTTINWRAEITVTVIP